MSRTRSTQPAPATAPVAPPASAIAARTATWTGLWYPSTAIESNIGPASTGTCSASFSASRSTISCGLSEADGVAGRAAAAGDAPRPTARCTVSSSIPRSPASLRTYSGRSAWSLIFATSGAVARSAPTRPSAVSRSYRDSTDRSANAISGSRRATRSRTAASPLASRSSHGSMLSGPTAMYVCPTKRWSSSKARSAAFCPAASPSKVKMISPANASVSMSSRRSTAM